MASRRARVELRTELGATRLQEVLVLLHTINLRGGSRDSVNLASIQPSVCDGRASSGITGLFIAAAVG
jgi:hypothetical protein